VWIIPGSNSLFNQNAPFVDLYQPAAGLFCQYSLAVLLSAAQVSHHSRCMPVRHSLPSTASVVLQNSIVLLRDAFHVKHISNQV
jgi:hypothetical protein